MKDKLVAVGLRGHRLAGMARPTRHRRRARTVSSASQCGAALGVMPRANKTKLIEASGLRLQ
jgi:hypothetical protein